MAINKTGFPPSRVYTLVRKGWRESTLQTTFGTGGAWVALVSKRLTLDFGSGCDLRVVRPSPALGSALRCLFEILFPFLSLWVR